MNSSQITELLSLTNIGIMLIGIIYGYLFNKISGLSSAIAVIILLPMLSTLHPTPETTMVLFYSVLFGSECIGESDMGKQLITMLSGFVIAASAYIIYHFSKHVIINFSSSDIFAVILFTLAAFIAFSLYNPLKAIVSTCIGMIVATVGVDSTTGVLRATYNEPELFDGINFITVATAVYMVTSIYSLICSKRNSKKTKIRTNTNILRVLTEAIIGGLVPNVGKRSDKREDFLYKSSLITTSILPLLTLGIPISGTMAVIYGAMGTFNIPYLYESTSDSYIKTVCLSFFVILLFIFIINSFFIRYAGKIKKAPIWLLASILSVLSFAGVYSSIASPTSLFICFTLGTVAYFLKTQGYPRHFILIGFIMSSPLENNLRRSLAISNGELNILFISAVSQLFWLMTAGVILTAFIISRRKI